MKCKFEVGSTVTIQVADQEASIIGRAEYANSEPQYLLRYAAPTGATETWWGESALKGDETA